MTFCRSTHTMHHFSHYQSHFILSIIALQSVTTHRLAFSFRLIALSPSSHIAFTHTFNSVTRATTAQHSATAQTFISIRGNLLASPNFLEVSLIFNTNTNFLVHRKYFHLFTGQLTDFPETSPNSSLVGLPDLAAGLFTAITDHLTAFTETALG